jgi:hypothetical protein
VGAEEVGGVGAEGGERGVEAAVGEVAFDEEGDLRGGDLLFGNSVRSGGLGRRHGGAERRSAALAWSSRRIVDWIGSGVPEKRREMACRDLACRIWRARAGGILQGWGWVDVSGGGVDTGYKGREAAGNRTDGAGGGGEEGLREEGDGVRVRVGCCVIYQGNMMRTIGSMIDGCKSLGYLGRHGLLYLLIFFFFFPFYCTIVK